jgi:molecular chaperone HscB
MEARLEQQEPSAGCVYCGVALEEPHFCARCLKIQPIAPGTDYFGFFGLPRRLTLDREALEKAFYALSRRFHPDYFTNASAAEQQASIDRSSMLNDAYRALREPVERARYLLTLEGYKEAEKKAPPELLEEVFELNMQIEELKAARESGDPDGAAEARRELNQALGGLREKLAEIDGKITRLSSDWDQSADQRDATGAKQSLDRLSEALSHRSYITNLIAEIEEEV